MPEIAWPSAVVFDPAAARVPPDIDKLFPVQERIAVVMLLAGARAREQGWSAQTAIRLADHCGATGRCVLIDLAFDEGELHEPLATENVEGIADVFLYGASVRHVEQRPSAHAFEFVSVGDAAGEAENVIGHLRWPRLLTELRTGGALVFLYVPGDAPAVERLAVRVDAVLALGFPDDLPALDARLSDQRRLGVLSPPQPKVVEPVETPQEPEAAEPAGASSVSRSPDAEFNAIRLPREAAREALIADLRARQRAALMSAPVLGDAPAAAPDAAPAVAAQRAVERRAPAPPPLTEPGFVTAAPRRRAKSSRTFFWVFSLIVFGGLVYGGFLVVRRHLEARAAQSQPSPAPAEATEPANPGVSGRLPYSIAVEAHQELPLALERVNALSEEDPDLGFYIVPILVNNVLYYRVMAGPVSDSLEVGRLMRRLLEKGHKTGAAASDVRADSLSFLIGEFDSRTAAAERARDAIEVSIPTYIIELPQSSGKSRFRVYAGAYTGPIEATVMAQLLRSAGLPDSLVQRIGKQQ